MPRAARLLAALFALACFALPTQSRALGITPINGNLYVIGTPAVSPGVDEYWLLRVNLDVVPVKVDSVVKLPTGNAPVDMDVSPINGAVYVLAKSSIYRVDPCTGEVATIATGGYVAAPQPPSMCLMAHSDGQLYLCRGGVSGGVVRVDPMTGSQTFLTNTLTTHSVSTWGLTEGPDHFLYAATSGGSGSLPWVLRINPASGATTLVASGVQSTNVRDIAFDVRDSLYVLREGSPPSVHRVDRTTGQVGQLTTLSGIVATTLGWMVAHPDGYLYMAKTSLGNQSAVYRLDPATGSFAPASPPQSQLGYAQIALVRGFKGCPVPVRSSSWGAVKTIYR